MRLLLDESLPRPLADLQNIEFQQNLKALSMAVVVLVAESNRLESLEPLVPDILQVLETLQPKVLVRVGVNVPIQRRRAAPSAATGG